MDNHDVFLSYARPDRDSAAAITSALIDRDIRVWWYDGIRAGAKFESIIDEALDRAACVVVLWSAHSIGSEWVKMEAQYGLARDRLLPVFLDTLDLPQPFHRLETNRSDEVARVGIDQPGFRTFGGGHYRGGRSADPCPTGTRRS